MTLDLDCRYNTQINVYCRRMTSQELKSVQIYRCSTTPLLSPLPLVHIALIKTTWNASVPCSHLLCFIYFVGRWKHKLLLSCVLLECKLFSTEAVGDEGRVCVSVCVGMSVFLDLSFSSLCCHWLSPCIQALVFEDTAQSIKHSNINQSLPCWSGSIMYHDCN